MTSRFDYRTWQEEKDADLMCWDFLAQKMLDDPSWDGAFREAVDQLKRNDAQLRLQQEWCERRGKNFGRNKEYAILSQRSWVMRQIIQIFTEAWMRRNPHLFRKHDVNTSHYIVMAARNLI